MAPPTSPETKLRERVIEVLTAEFAAEGIEFRSDKLTDNLGQDGPIAGVYPGYSQSRQGKEMVLDVICYVQLFGPWRAVVEPTMIVDPTPLEEWAERIRRAIRDADVAGPGADAHLWYFDVQRVDYTNDPGGNVSRLLVTIAGEAQNPAIVPTTG